jgi:hypothetical protein
MTNAVCDRCFRTVPEDALVEVEVSKATRSSPAEYESRCRRCGWMGEEELEALRDEAGDRARDEAAQEAAERWANDAWDC